MSSHDLLPLRKKLIKVVREKLMENLLCDVSSYGALLSGKKCSVRRQCAVQKYAHIKRV